MKQNVHVFLFFLLLSGAFFKANAQERYLDQVFSEVNVQKDVVYGVNATILLQRQVGEAVPQALRLDLYTPVGDTRTDRPLVIYLHTGNFLPWPQNGGASGTRSDSTVVDICTKLAKMGYVVASASYRLGWDPTNTVKDIRVFTLLNAAYRGVQDARTAIRFFRRGVEEAGNPYGIDPNKIVLWGQGTGGYLSTTTSSLDNYLKIPTASDGKFLISVAGNIIPMVVPGVNGDIEGKTVGIVPPEFAAVLGLPAGDTLCYPNHVAQSSDFAMSVNMGGAVADTAWIDPGQKPMISIHTTNDPFAPYKEGLVLVPGTPPLEVVKVQGSYLIQKLSNDYGNNNKFAPTARTWQDPYSKASRVLNDGYEGLYPVVRSNLYDSSPWDFWSSSNPNDSLARRTNPDMSPEKARKFIDTLIGYYAPRACLTLGLGCKKVKDGGK